MADDQDGKLSEEDKKKFIDWLNLKWTTAKNCPICTKNTWAVANYVVAPLNLNESGLSLSSSYPVVQINCNNCGYVLSFNAGVSDIRSSSSAVKEEGNGDE